MSRHLLYRYDFHVRLAAAGLFFFALLFGLTAFWLSIPLSFVFAGALLLFVLFFPARKRWLRYQIAPVDILLIGENEETARLLRAFSSRIRQVYTPDPGEAPAEFAKRAVETHHAAVCLLGDIEEEERERLLELLFSEGLLLFSLTACDSDSRFLKNYRKKKLCRCGRRFFVYRLKDPQSLVRAQRRAYREAHG